MAGKIAIVTGATGGIGKEIARGLARAGATVIVGARTVEKGEQARDEIRKDASGEVETMVVDVARAASIRAFVTVFEAKHAALHVLVNNAGAWFTDRREQDGHELTLATNVLGPYLLTRLLVPRLAAAHGARVVNIVSGLAANYDASDLEWTRRPFDGFKVYAQSKQALRMLTWRFSDELAAQQIMVNAAAPGFVKTAFNQHAKGFLAGMINFSAKLFAVSPAKGADTPLWVATAPELAEVTGKYFDKRKEQDGKFRDPAPLVELARLCDAMVGAGN